MLRADDGGTGVVAADKSMCATRVGTVSKAAGGSPGACLGRFASLAPKHPNRSPFEDARISDRNFAKTRGVDNGMTTGTQTRCEGHSSNRAQRLEIACVLNVTPLIDVLLVLLIIFLIITPQLSHGLDASIPNQDGKASRAETRDVVVKIAADRSLTVNSESVSWARLSDRLSQIYASRASKVMFLTADRQVEYNDVAQVIDAAHGAGITQVGLMPKGPAKPAH